MLSALQNRHLLTATLGLVVKAETAARKVNKRASFIVIRLEFCRLQWETMNCEQCMDLAASKKRGPLRAYPFFST